MSSDAMKAWRRYRPEHSLMAVCETRSWHNRFNGAMKPRIAFLLATASGLWAHPMGPFSVSHYTRLEVSAQGVEVTYILDLAEVPTYILLRDGKPAHEWTKGLEFRAGGEPVEPRSVRAAMQTSAGADGQSTLRITSTFELPGAKSPLQFEDHNFPDRFGWKEIVIRAKAGVQIVTASQDSTDQSRALTDYPTGDVVPGGGQDLRASVDWRVSSPAAPARIVPIPQPTPVMPEVAPPAPSRPAKDDFLSRLLAKKQIGWQWLLLGLVVAFGLGGAHALEPGHGKTIVAAYLVGSRGTMKHAALLGAVVTFTHTISVFLLGLGMLVLSKSIVPGNVIRSLEAVSGLSIVAIGAVMFYQRLRQLLHTMAHEHHDHHHHAHDHHHHHEHGPHGHSHLPEGEVTLGSLIALGVSGGLVPCPAALVIMLAAIAFGHVGAGLVLLVAFSLGLAGVLMAVGMMVLYARSWLPNPDATSRHPIFRLVPVLSALIIVCLGLLMTGVSLGWVRPGLSV
jgi:nickel/cobalt transporter (NicO) family protein